MLVGWGLFAVWEMFLPDIWIPVSPSIMDGAPDRMLYGAPISVTADPCNIRIDLFDDALGAILGVTWNCDAYLLVSDTVNRKP